MMPEPTLSEVHADLVGRLEQDKRLRALEQTTATLTAVVADMPRMEQRLKEAITELKPKSPWPAVAAITGVVSVALVIAALLFK
jgi:hypothetical protein